MPETHDAYPLLEITVASRPTATLDVGDIIGFRAPKPACGNATATNTIRFLTDSLQPEQATALTQPWQVNDDVLAKRRYCLPPADLEALGVNLAQASDVTVVHQPLMPMTHEQDEAGVAQGRYRFIDVDSDGQHTEAPVDLSLMVWDKAIQDYVTLEDV